MNIWIGLAIGLVLVYVGITDAVATWRDRRRKALATVNSSSVEPVGASGLYKLALAYTYRVHGRPYEGSVIDMRSLSEHGARKLSEAYRPGATIDVYYLPKCPESSVLSFRVELVGSILIGVAGVAAMAVTIFLHEMDAI